MQHAHCSSNAEFQIWVGHALGGVAPCHALAELLASLENNFSPGWSRPKGCDQPGFEMYF